MIAKFFTRAFLFLVAILLLTLLIFSGLAHLRETQSLGEVPYQGGELISTDEGNFYSLQKGSQDGIPIVLTHGTAAWSGLWLDTMENLGENGYRAISFDMPPFGFSEHASDRDYSRQRQAERFLSFIDALDVKPIVVAHSFSAGMVAEAAMLNSEAFAGLVFVDAAIGLNSHLDPKSTPWLLQNYFIRRAVAAVTVSNPLLTDRFLQRFVHVKAGVTPKVVEVLKQPMARAGYTSAVTDWLPQLFETPKNALSTKPEAWQKLTVPTAFLWGDKDTVTPLSQAEELKKLTSGSSLTVLPKIGHIPQIEAPQVFQGKLVSVVDTLTSKTLRKEAE